jgi:hypothetical protein
MPRYMEPFRDEDGAGAGETTTGATSASSSAPFFQDPPPAETPPPDFDTFVPEKYKTAAWLEPIKKSSNPNKIEELFSQFENTQKLIGQKTVGLQPPTDKSSPEEIAAWRKATNVPEQATEYEYKPLDVNGRSADEAELITYLNAQRDEGFISDMKAAAHKYGIPKETFNALAREIDEAALKRHKEALTTAYAEQKQLDADFETLGTQFFGNRFAEVTDQGKQMLQRLVLNKRPELAPFVNQLDNKALLVMSAAFSTFADRYMKEDTFFKNDPNSGALTPAEHKAIGAKLMADPAYSNPTHAGHAAAVEKVQRHFGTGRFAGTR